MTRTISDEQKAERRLAKREALVKATPLYKFFRDDMINRFPALATCTSATEASKILFGVKGMANLIFASMAERDAIAGFFGSDHSAMAAWYKASGASELEGYQHVTTHTSPRYYSAKKFRARKLKQPEYTAHVYLQFNAEPGDRKVYDLLVKWFGLDVIAPMTKHRDFSDMCKGIAYLKADKKRWAKFQDVVATLPVCTPTVRLNTIHDYAIQRMKDAEKREANKGKAREAETPTLPAFPLPEVVGEYKILVPRTDKDLRRIGTAQRHCVGTKAMGYADEVRAGQICIVALYKKNIGDGVCVEIELPTESGSLYVKQAQGRHRRAPEARECDVIDQLCATLNQTVGTIDPHTPTVSYTSGFRGRNRW